MIKRRPRKPPGKTCTRNISHRKLWKGIGKDSAVTNGNHNGEIYRELVENANSIIAKTDREGNMTFVNAFAQTFFGYSSDEMLGRNIRMLLPRRESNGRNLMKVVDEILRNPDDFVESINENILRDGTRVWISWRNRAIRDAHGSVVGILAVGQDITRLKKSEEALRESEQRFRSLFENSLDGIVVSVVDGTILSANARMCEMLGMTEEEIIAAGREGIVVKDERLAAALAERRRTGRFQGELTYRRKDGSLLPAELSVTTFKDLDGTVKSGQVVRDISERKHTEEMLRKAHDELELRVEQRTAEIKRQADLLELTHDAVIVRNDFGEISFWSAGAEEIYGWTKAEAVGAMIQDLLQTEFPIPFSEIVEITERDGRWEGELIHTCKHGKRIVALSRWALRESEQDESSEIMEVNSDITARKEIEDALRTAGVYNRSLIEASLDPLVTIGPDGTVTDVNIATEVATGYSRIDLIGTDFSDYFTDPEKARTGYKRVFEEGFVRDYELEIMHRDGHVVPVLYNASVYREPSGEIAGVFAAARDITDRKRTEEELLNKSRALEELNTALKVLIEHHKNDQRELEERVATNVRMRITPYIEKLKQARLEVNQAALVEIIERAFREIASPFLKTVSSEQYRFTQKELEIIALIKDGRSTKEIAQILSLGKRTIDSYRDTIRNKLALSDRKVNLRTYLLSLKDT